MGTRNITRVISNGQLKVCQYCQWDGYPTGAGADIANFIRTTDDDHMIKRLEHVTLVTDVDGNTFCTGAPVFDGSADIARDEWDFRPYTSKEFRMIHPDGSGLDEYEYIKRRVNEMLVEKYGPEIMQKWHIAIRDTGCAVLPIIYDSTNDLTVYTSEYLLDNYGDWQIEGVWELNYDTKVLTGWWHDCKMSWTFGALRRKTDEELEGTMVDFEQLGWEE